MIERRVTHRSSAWPLRDRARSMDNADPQPVHLTMAEMCPKKPDHFNGFLFGTLSLAGVGSWDLSRPRQLNSVNTAVLLRTGSLTQDGRDSLYVGAVTCQAAQ